MADEINSATAGQREEQSLLLKYLQIDINDNEEKIKALKRFTEEEKELPTIHRVPDVLRKMNEGAYTPSVVAIGPLHRGKKHLKPMEGEKLSYMHFLFDRTGNFDLTRDACVDAMLKMESFARRYYADDVMGFDEDDEPVVNLESLKTRDEKGCADKKVRFAQMMLIDGCFMIEFFYRHYRNEIDPIRHSPFKLLGVREDLVRLENQLPFAVLEELFRLTVQRISENRRLPSLTLTECVLSFYYNEMSIEGSPLEKRDDKPTAHLLHLLHSCYLPWDEAKKPEPRQNHEEIDAIENFKYSATELDLGGIKFVQGNKNDIFEFEFRSTPYSYFCFWRRGQFKIPPFEVHDSTEMLWRNFIAFEQSCRFMVDSYFTSHTVLMDKLINNAEDVKLLEKKGIIVNNMGSSEEVAHIFNNVGNNIAFVRLYPTKECLEIIKFHQQTWPKFLVKLRRDYFSNPWTVISVVAAFILFLLTLLQTIYTMRS